MNVLIDVRPLARGASSGIPVFTKEIVSRLIETRDNYHLFYPGLRSTPLPATWLSRSNVRATTWPVPGRFLDVSSLFLKRPRLDRLAPESIIFSPHANYLIPGSSPRVLVVHDLSFIHYPEQFTFRQRAWHATQKITQQIKEATHIIAVSDFTRADLIETLQLSPEKISVVHPGISREFRKIDSRENEMRFFFRKHSIAAPYFLYFGALESRKNVESVIAAFDLLRTDPRHKGYELIIAGRAGHGASHILSMRARAKSKDAIRIISYVTDAERALLYNGAVAFVCASFFEGFGFPVLEAQACGVPVIASERTSFTETLGKSAVLTSPWKASQLAEAMAALGLENQKRDQFIASGLENTKRFSWDTAAVHVHAILTSINKAHYG